MTDTPKTVRLRVSPDVARIVAPNAPRELQLAAARGAVPLQGPDLVIALMFLCHEADESIRQLALQTFRALPASVLEPLVQDHQTNPQQLHFIARARLHDAAVISKLLANPAVEARTLALVARYAKKDVLAMLACDDLALKRVPQLAEMICANPAADRDLKFRLGWREETLTPAREQEGPEPPAREEDHSGQEERDDHEAGEDVAEEEYEGEEEIDGLTMSKYQMALEMPVSEKIRMAMTGDKEWRTILMREANKLVSSAVLKNPRITEGEVLGVAKNRSASDELIRLITLNNEWLKNLEIKKALVVHPRTPLPKALRYMSVLTEKDIRHIAKSRNVSQVIANNARRILAAKEKKR